MTSTEIEANITFGWAKLKLLLRIYNLRVSYPNCKIYLALANIAACFCFPRVHVDLTGTLDLWLRKCISWKPAWSSVPPLQLVVGNLFDEQSKDRSSSTPQDLTWSQLINTFLACSNGNTRILWSLMIFARAIACPLNHGIPELDGSHKAYICVDDVMGSEVGKLNILRLLAATIEAIFAVCSWANIEVRQCSLSIENWEQLVIGPIQTVLELTVDTNKLTVAITQGYRDQVREFLTLHWPISCWIFKVVKSCRTSTPPWHLPWNRTRSCC